MKKKKKENEENDQNERTTINVYFFLFIYFFFWPFECKVKRSTKWGNGIDACESKLWKNQNESLTEKEWTLVKCYCVCVHLYLEKKNKKKFIVDTKSTRQDVFSFLLLLFDIEFLATVITAMK